MYSDTPNHSSKDVIRLDQDFADLRGTTPLIQVETYWHALRGGRIVPARTDIDPRGIEDALSQSFIVERIAPGHARIRIAGTHVSDLMGMEVRGMPLSALFEPVGRVQLQAALRGLFDAPAIQKFALSSETRLGKPSLVAQMALYPLRDEQGQITRALGCLVTEGNIGRAPRRFTVKQVKRQNLVGDRFIAKALPAMDEPGFALPAPSPVAQAAEDGATFQSTAVPWLRVVQNHDD